MSIALTVLSILLALAFAGAGLPKLTGSPKMTKVFQFLRVPDQLRRPIGALEIAAAAGLLAGLWLQPLGIAAAAGLALLMAGAVAYHVRAGDAAQNTAGPGILLALSATTLGLHLALI